MKQVIPFKKEILFKTKICEITSISLEHTLSLVEDDLINGEFIISGDYKMTEGSINREKFLYKIPCEISLVQNYKKDNLIIDIDNFYYEVVNNEYLNVFIDIYIDGEEKKELENVVPEIIKKNEDREEVSIITEEDKKEIDKEITNINSEPIEIETKESNEMGLEINDKKETKIENNTFNIFNSNIDNSDEYVTYHVYIIKEEDNIDNIINKFNTNKDIISEYNDLENIKPGNKLIIPNNKDE